MAAGAALGSVVPGVGTAIGGAVGAVADIFAGPMVGSAPSSASSGPRSAATAVYGSGLSGDNWAVNFGGTQNASGRVDKPFSATGPTASTAATGGAILPAPGGMLSGVASSLGLDLTGVPMWAWLGLGGLVIWKLKSRK